MLILHTDSLVNIIPPYLLRDILQKYENAIKV